MSSVVVGWLIFLAMVTTGKPSSLSLTPFVTVGRGVSHISADLYFPGNILFSEVSSLLTSGQDDATVIVGERNQSSTSRYREGVAENATFREISSFVQPNTTHVFVADAGYGCVRSVERITRSTHRVAGTCAKLSEGETAVDGNLLSATFNKLGGIDYYNEAIYVIETFEYRIRKIDFATGNVTTVVTKMNFYSNQHLPWDMAILPSSNAAFVTLSYGIARLNLTNNTFEYLTKKVHEVGSKDGALADSNWYYDTSIAVLGPYLFVIDLYTYRIRVINTNTSQVSTLGRFTFKGKPFPAAYMTAIGLYQCKLYVNLKKSRTIYHLQLPEPLCAQATLEKLLPNGSSARDAGIIGGAIAGGVLIGAATIATSAHIHKKWTRRRTHDMYRAQYNSVESNVTLKLDVGSKKLT